MCDTCNRDFELPSYKDFVVSMNQLARHILVFICVRLTSKNSANRETLCIRWNYIKYITKESIKQLKY